MKVAVFYGLSAVFILSIGRDTDLMYNQCRERFVRGDSPKSVSLVLRNLPRTTFTLSPCTVFSVICPRRLAALVLPFFQER